MAGADGLTRPNHQCPAADLHDNLCAPRVGVVHSSITENDTLCTSRVGIGHSFSSSMIGDHGSNCDKSNHYHFNISRDDSIKTDVGADSKICVDNTVLNRHPIFNSKTHNFDDAYRDCSREIIHSRGIIPFWENSDKYCERERNYITEDGRKRLKVDDMDKVRSNIEVMHVNDKTVDEFNSNDDDGFVCQIVGDSSDAKDSFKINSILDSGASHHTCGIRDCFKCLTGRRLNLKVADRRLPVPGEIGLFKENTLGLREGIYHPSLDDLFLTSSESLVRDGNIVHQSPTERYVESPSGERHGVTVMNKLPTVDITFGEGNEARVFTCKADVVQREHERMGHFYVPGLNSDNCQQCKLAKGQAPGVRKIRPEEYKPKKPLEQVDGDFTTNWPASYNKKVLLFSLIDSFTGWAENYPIRYKDEACECLKKWCVDVGQPLRVRTDNEPVLKGDESGWKKTCRSTVPPIKATHSKEYLPSTNGVAERWNRTSSDSIRANMVGVDPKLWDWCAKYVPYVWNRIPRRKGKRSPFFKLKKRECSLKHFRRFGCLAYAKVHTGRGKLDPKFERGVFLGYSSSNSTYLVGVWRIDKRCLTNFNFEVTENAVVHFDESCLISDIEHLKTLKKGTFTPFKSPGDLCESTSSVLSEKVLAGSHESAVGASREAVKNGIPYVPKDAGLVQQPALETGLSPAVDGCQDDDSQQGNLPQPANSLDHGSRLLFKGSLVESPSSSNPPDATASGDVGSKLPVNVEPNVNDRSNTHPEKSDSQPKPPEGDVPKDEVVEQLSNGVQVKRRRGRPAGLTRQPHWKKPGPKSKDLDAAALSIIIENLPEEVDIESDDELDPLEFEVDPDEEVVACTVQVTRKEAFEGPEAAQWFQADELEKLQLTSLECWRPLKDGELKQGDEIIPSVVLYTKKRCGRYKARLVALGNRQKCTNVADIYSPTVSHAANRHLLVETAAHGWYEEQFDISNAFIKSTLDDDEKVIVRLPKHWSKDPKGDKVRLLKCLYGLRISPRKWFDTYKAFLIKQGWEMCFKEPGLFRKKDSSGQYMHVTVYVDDSIIVGPNQADIRIEMNKILKRFPGKVIPPVIDGEGNHIRDVIGVTMKYNREKKYLDLTIEKAIDKFLKQYNMENCRPVATPCIPGEDVAGGEADPVFPLRALVGCLLYIAVMCRPDISFAVQRVARCVCSPTKNAVRAGKRILAYLKKTKHIGIIYSPEHERAFRETFSPVVQVAGKSLPNTIAFGDADFAGCSDTLKSTSGSIIYHRGSPIAWSAKRQTLRATSTCQAEYIALYDTMRLCQKQGFLSWYFPEGSLPLILCDNQSAIATAISTFTTKATKHFLLRLHEIRDHKDCIIYCPTDINRADPLTKPLSFEKYSKLFHSGE